MRRGSLRRGARACGWWWLLGSAACGPNGGDERPPATTAPANAHEVASPARSSGTRNSPEEVTGEDGETKVSSAPPDGGSEDETTATRQRSIELNHPREANVALLVEGGARVAWFARAVPSGGAPLEVAIEETDEETAFRGGSPRLRTVSVAWSGSPGQPATLELPGRGSRAVRLRARAPAGLSFERLLVRDTPSAPATGSPLAGALRGRSCAIVSCDALRADRLGCFGHTRPTSPHLDALAAEGVRFSAARSQTAWTVPSVATLFTGVEQERHGVRDVGETLPDSLPTLAEAFQAAGYATAAFLQNKLVTRETGLDRGFDEWHEFPGEAKGQLLPALAKWLAQPRAQPLFIYVHFLPPHAPYQPPAEFAGRFGAPKPGADGSIEALAKLTQLKPRADDARVLAMLDLYDSHVAYGDALVGETASHFFTGRRDAAGNALARDTAALLFLADHAEAFGEHKAVGHNTLVHDEMVHVPFLLTAPGSPLPAGRVVTTPTTTADWPPTLTELFALPQSELPSDAAPAFAASRSLVDQLSDPLGDPPAPSADASTGSAARPTRTIRLSARYQEGQPLQRALLWGRFKLVAPFGTATATPAPFALFDLTTDPKESRDVRTSQPLVAAALYDELLRWSAEPLAKPASSFAPDEKLRREMEALGYGAAGGR